MICGLAEHNTSWRKNIKKKIVRTTSWMNILWIFAIDLQINKSYITLKKNFFDCPLSKGK